MAEPFFEAHEKISLLKFPLGGFGKIKNQQLTGYVPSLKWGMCFY
jgi:hypothetical protein